MQIEKIYKRNHAEMPYKVEKITEAVLKAMISVQNGGQKTQRILPSKLMWFG